MLRKGSITVDKAHLDLLLKKDRQTVIRMPSDREHSLFMGIKLADRLLFFDLSPEELENLRKMYIMKTIIENEKKRLNIADITIYDGSGHVYLGSDKRSKNVFSILKPLDSRYFPNYSMEILVSNRLAERHHQEDEREFHHAAAFPRPRRGRGNFPDIPARKKARAQAERDGEGYGHEGEAGLPREAGLRHGPRNTKSPQCDQHFHTAVEEGIRSRARKKGRI